MAAKFTVTGYKFKPGSRLSPKLAPVVGKRLAELTALKGDSLLAEDVVEDAQSPASPLHAIGVFEWDDSIAAAEHRLNQARYLLRSIEIEYIDTRGSSGETRAYAVVVENEEQHFVPIVRVLGHRGLREQYLAAAERELAFFTKKYEGLKELFNVVVAAKQFLRTRQKRRRRRTV